MNTRDAFFSSCYCFLPQEKRFFTRLRLRCLPTVDFVNKQPRKSWLRFASYGTSGRG